MVKISFVEDKSSLPLTDEQREMFAFSAVQDGKLLGYCLFTLGVGTVTLQYLHTEPGDIALADGIARTVLDGCRSIVDRVRIADGCDELDCFANLTGKFIGSEAEIDKILSGCCGHSLTE